MICAECKHANPGGNRFCGMCGALLPQAPASGSHSGQAGAGDDAAQPSAPPESQETREPGREARRPAQAVPIGAGGPSFLGLEAEADDAAEAGEDRHRYRGEDLYRANWGARVAFALVVLAIVAGLGYMQWRSDHSMWGIFQKPASSQTNSVAQPSAPAAAEASPVVSPAPSAQAAPQTGAASSTAQGAADANSAASAPTPGASASASPAAGSAASTSTNPAPAATANHAAETEQTPASPASSAAPPAANNSDEKRVAKRAPTVEKTTPESASAEKQAAETKAKSFARASAAPAPADSAAADDAVSPDTTNAHTEPAPATRKPAGKAGAAAGREVSDEPVKLADIYLEGKRVPQNCDEGVGILRAADGRGNERATIKLGALYATGECVPLDRVIAYHYFSRAHSADPTNEWVEQNRAMLWTSMSDEERARARDLDGAITRR